MEELKKLIEEYIEKQEMIHSAIASNPINRDKISKVKLRPVMVKDQISYQAESFIGTKAYHKNFKPTELSEYMVRLMKEDFKQLELESESEKVTVLVSKKGKVTINRKKNQQTKKLTTEEMSHNKKKQYVLPKDTPVPFLVDLGVQTQEGKIVNARYDKFRQINRYLEFVRDILPSLPKD